jgi:NADH-quinone oxidoreductase subunit N
MTGGNIVALAQTNVKRMLAYSSIAHTGYIMAGLAAFAAATTPQVQQQGIEAILFYVLGYGVMNIAAFAVVGMLQRDPRRYGGLASFAGLAGRAPALAAAMAILLLSLTGIPPTVGFFAKLYVLLAAVDAGLGWLAVLIALNAALAAFYYLRVIVYMYMRDAEPDPAPIERHPFGSFALVLSVAGVVLLGLFPEPILGFLRSSAGSLF